MTCNIVYKDYIHFKQKQSYFKVGILTTKLQN